MVVGNVPEGADFVVIGAGPGGYTAALQAAARGRNVMLIDALGVAGVGGVCLNVGCIPSKALIEAAELYHRARSSAFLGLPLFEGSFSVERFQDFRHQIVTGLSDSVRRQLASAKVNIVAGRATLTEPNVLVIDTPDNRARFVQFKSLVIATGSSPVELPELPSSPNLVLDSTAFLEQSSLPETLLVIGGGYIGLELGTAAAKLGTKVTIIEAEANLLPAMPHGLARPIQRRLVELGVRTILETRVLGFDGEVAHLERADGETSQHNTERLLVSVGRRPNTTGLGLEAIISDFDGGVLSPGGDRLITPHIAAIGDITPGPSLAHKATAEAAVAVQALCGESATFDPAAIPAVVFSDPEVGSAGLSHEDAIALEVNAGRARLPLAASGRAATLGAREGFVEVVWDRQDGAVLGVHIAAPHASELIAEAVLAIEMGATVEDLALMVHPHPTLSELLAEAATRGDINKGGS